MRHVRIAALLVVAVCSLAADSVGDFLVIAARGAAASRYPKGTWISKDTTLDLADDDAVVVLSSSGERVTLTSTMRKLPATPAPASATDTALRAIADMLRLPPDGRSVLGTVRDVPDGVGPSDPTVVDVRVAGTKCLVADRPVVLWRPKDSPGGRVSLQALSDGQTHYFDWPGGTERMPWPDAIRRRDGDRYLFSSSTSSGRRFVLAIAPGDASPGQQLLFFVERGCRRQAALMLAELERASLP